MPRSRLGSKTEERNGGEQNSEGSGINKHKNLKQRCDPLLDLSGFDFSCYILLHLKNFNFL